MSISDQENVPIPDEELTEYTVKSSYSQYTKILLIDKNVEQYQKFVNGANSSTFTIVYKDTSKHKHLEEFLVANLKHVTRLAIVSHGLPGEEHHHYHNLSFMENEHFFKMSDLTSGATNFSPNVAFLKTLLTKMSINRMDFLACNLLRYTEWTQYLDLLKSFKSGLVVGASNDQTGNLQYGGNWTMENTLDNIKTVYFSSAIENYTGLLNRQYVTIDDNGTSRTWGYDMGGWRIWTCSDLTGIVNVPRFTYNPTMPTQVVLNVFQNSTTASNVIINDLISEMNDTFHGCTTLTSFHIATTCSVGHRAFKDSNITSIEFGEPYNRLNGYHQSTCYNCTNLTSVTLTSSVTNIGGDAFDHCSSLTHITIPSGLEHFDGFNHTGIQSVTIEEPSSLTTITGLRYTQITSINLPSTVKTIAGFNHTPIQSINIPAGLTSLTGFHNCPALTALDVPDTCTLATNRLNYTYEYVIYNCPLLTSFTLPSTLSLNSNWPHRIIGGTVGFSSITIPYGCSLLGYIAFASASLTQIVVPDTCTASAYAFSGHASANQFSKLQVYTSNNIYYNYIGSSPLGSSLTHGGYDAVMATFDTTDTANWSLLGEKIALPDPSGNVLEITTLTSQDLTDENVTGTTTVSKRSYTKSLIKGLFSFNGSSLTGKVVTLKNITLPGFAPAEEVVVFNSSTNESAGFTNTLNTASIAGKNFYVLMENTNDTVTIPTVSSSITVTKTGDTTFSINNGLSLTTVNSGESYTHNGLTINLGSVYGYLVDPSTICFKEGTKIACLDENSNPAEIPVEELRTGMFVKTYKHGYIPVHTIGTKKLYNPENDTREKDRLYECTPEQYPDLTENLYITGCHSILVDQLTEQQSTDTLRETEDIFITDDKYRLMAFLDERAQPWTNEGTYSIYHIYLDHPDDLMNYGIYANGLLVESCSKRSMEEKSYMTLSTVEGM